MTETATQPGTWYKGSDLDLDQLRKVLEAIRDGDFSQRMPTGLGYKAGSIARVINSMANMLEALSAEHMRVAEECGTHGSLGCQAEVESRSVMEQWRACAQKTANPLPFASIIACFGQSKQRARARIAVWIQTMPDSRYGLAALQALRY